MKPFSELNSFTEFETVFLIGQRHFLSCNDGSPAL
jgi:hypothetical protein